jgi:hypothetical protein
MKAYMYQLLGKTSPYKDGRSVINSTTDKYTITAPDTYVHLRDVDNGLQYYTYPIVINPKQTDDDGNVVTQNVPIKLFEFTPIDNGSDIPSFLAELTLSGDLVAYKGILSSCTRDRVGNKRGVKFEADYVLNQDLPFSLKVLYNKTMNKVVVAFKFDVTSNSFASIVKFDCSVDLMIGKDLEFAEPDTIMNTNITLS